MNAKSILRPAAAWWRRGIRRLHDFLDRRTRRQRAWIVALIVGILAILEFWQLTTAFSREQSIGHIVKPTIYQHHDTDTIEHR